MIREYAVDPQAAFRNTDSLQRFLSDFRAENGRVIAGFPRSWEREQQNAIRQLGLPTISRKKAFDQIKQMAKQCLTGGFTPPQGNCWLDQALDVDRQCSLNGIIYSEVDTQRKMFDYSNLLEAEPDDWEIPQTKSVPRQAAALASSIECSLKLAKSPVLYIDPYFHPADERYRAPLREFINKMTQGRHNPSKLFIHTSEQGDKRRVNIEGGLNDHIAPVLPAGFTVETWIWPNQLMHDRFILTKQVGYSFGHGLDEANYQAALDVNIQRLSENMRKEHFTTFSTEAARLGDAIIVTGQY